MPRMATMFCALMLSAALLGAAEKSFAFSELKEGDVPSGFKSVLSGEGPPGEWRIVLDETPQAFPAGPVLTGKSPVKTKRPVLAQLSRDRTEERSPMFVYEGDTFGDFKATTLFKLVDGEVEQMAGIAFRIQDENNYYYVRASGKGNSFNFYKILNGHRSPPVGARAQIAKGVWHEMSVECKGSQIRAWLNGQELIAPFDDKSFASGRIGYWTRGDSVSYFADTRVTYTPRQNLAQVLVQETIKQHPRLMALHVFATRDETQECAVIASSEATEIGRPAPPEVRDILARSIPYHGKDRDNVIITLPLRDRNGENAAVVKVVMKSFPGQTEANALARARPITRRMEARIQSRTALFE